MIEDKELRDLFRMECEEHLQCLDDGLLRLEQDAESPELLEDVFRAAHSVKGAARMLGLTEIQSLAHVLEDALGTLRAGTTIFDKSISADLYQKLAAIRLLVAEQVGDAVASEAVVSDTLPVKPEPLPLSKETQLTTAESVAEPTSKPMAQPAPKADNSSAEMNSASFRISTLRVDPQRLDVLLTHAGELVVTNAHIARRLPELETLVDRCEEWMRGFKSMGLSIQDESFALQGLSQLQETLSQLRAGLYEDSRRLDFVSEQLVNGIRTIRLLPFSTIFNQFPRLVHELSQSLNKEVELVMEGADVVADKRVLEELKDPIMHLLRNAVHHGLEDAALRISKGKPGAGKITIRASQSASHIILTVQDDGRGLELDKIKQKALQQKLYTEEQLALMGEAQLHALILAPGFTTTEFITEISGRGVGLDVVRANVDKLKGTVLIDSIAGEGVTFRLQLPLTLATMRVQIIGIQGCSYALPLESVQFSRHIKVSDLFTMEGRQMLSLEGQPVAMVHLSDLLELKRAFEADSSMLYATFLKVEDELFGLIVDELLDETEVMLKAQSKLLKRVRNVSATTILVSGEVCPVLNPGDLLKSLRKQYVHGLSSSQQLEFINATTDTSPQQKTLLLAEDSITTRTQEKRILESAGYNVVTAVDGLDAYNKFQNTRFDGVVSDVEMPNMSGLALTEAIRKDKQYADIPIILVTSLSSEADQRRGLEAGANAYLVKSAFDQQKLIDCLARLV